MLKIGMMMVENFLHFFLLAGKGLEERSISERYVKKHFSYHGFCNITSLFFSIFMNFAVFFEKKAKKFCNETCKRLNLHPQMVYFIEI